MESKHGISPISDPDAHGAVQVEGEDQRDAEQLEEHAEAPSDQAEQQDMMEDDRELEEEDPVFSIVDYNVLSIDSTVGEMKPSMLLR